MPRARSRASDPQRPFVVLGWRVLAAVDDPRRRGGNAGVAGASATGWRDAPDPILGDATGLVTREFENCRDSRSALLRTSVWTHERLGVIGQSTRARSARH